MMKSLSQFMEGISAEVYHYTMTNKAAQILKNDKFRLTAVATHSDNLAKGKKALSFYLSTTRSKTGHYTEINLEGVVLNLDGRKLGNNYSGQPVDYWGPEFRKVDQSINEMEDRIYHTKPTIPNASKYIKSIHVLIRVDRKRLNTTDRLFGDPEANKKKEQEILSWSSDWANKAMRVLWLQAKKKGIPIFFYDNKQNWLTQRKPLKLEVSKLKPGKVEKRTGRNFPSRNQLDPWLELLQRPTSQKSKLGRTAKRYLERSYDVDGLLRSFMADIGNEKTTGNAGKLIAWMRKNKIKDYPALMKYVSDKWERK